jgi:hypothetical protein
VANDLEAALEEVGNEEWVVDYSAAGQGDFTPLPPDTYHVRIEKTTYKISKSAKKTPMVTCQLDVTEGEHKGRKLFVHLLLSGAATWKTRKNLKALGIESEGDSIRLSPPMLADKEALAVVSGKDPEFPDSVDELKPAPGKTLADA